jgi:hypothetical protein
LDKNQKRIKQKFMTIVVSDLHSEKPALRAAPRRSGFSAKTASRFSPPASRAESRYSVNEFFGCSWVNRETKFIHFRPPPAAYQGERRMLTTGQPTGTAESGAGLSLARFARKTTLPGTPKLNATGIERRRAARYSIAAALRFPDGRGDSVNLSQTGILFETDSELEPGRLMKLTIVGEPGQDNAKPTYLLCEIFLLRVQEFEAAESGHRYRVAAAIKSVRVH